MCGRFTNKASEKDIKSEFKVGRLNKVSFGERYNIAPTQMIDAVLEQDSERVLTELKWGLIPSWAKDDSFAAKTINARAETLAEKPSFRNAFRSRRCIIPATGFYEWAKKGEHAKQPFYFYLKGKDVFGFAGLWEEWADKETGELIESCTIITTEANEVLEPVHDRMPVILDAANYDIWLAPDVTETEELQKLLVPFPASKMASHMVGKAVNSPSYDSPELIVNSK